MIEKKKHFRAKPSHQYLTNPRTHAPTKAGQSNDHKAIQHNPAVKPAYRQRGALKMIRYSPIHLKTGNTGIPPPNFVAKIRKR